jgi:parallel beta helix pectate lyase-like protein
MVSAASKSRLVSGGFAATLFLLLLPGMGRAANVQVVCPGGGPGVFSSINAALSTLDPHGPNTITVSGTCVENIFIFQHERLTIQAALGQTVTVNAADPSGIVLQTLESTGILISGLVFQGGSTGVFLNQGSNVIIVNCTMQRNSGDGLGMQMASTLVMENSTLQDNQGNGMTVDVASNATMATNPNERIRVLRNGGDGIDVDGSFFQVNFGTLDVENNGGAAILQTGGRMLIFGGQSVGGGNLFQGNGEGIDIFEAGSAHLGGRNVIRNNGDVGLQVLGSSVLFTGGILPDGTPNVTVIEGHATVGVNVVRLGELSMTGPHQIQNNGTATADATLRGGIRIVRGSLTLSNGVQVSSNVGPGIRADQNTGTSVTNITVSNNSEEGVRVGRQSVSGFFLPLTIAGNPAASISCDATSLVFGDLTGITNVECGRIERAAGPPRPGRVQN